MTMLAFLLLIFNQSPKIILLDTEFILEAKIYIE